MKILDRYVLGSFLKNYLISLMVLIGLYVVLDMVFNFDELVEARGSGAAAAGGVAAAAQIVFAIAEFYFYQAFVIFAQLSGIIPVVAAAFTLFRMTRQNELVAMMAAGLPLLRVVRPVVFAGVVLSFLLIVDQELLIPGMIPKLIRSHDQVAQQTARSYPIRAMRDDYGGLLNAAQYYPPTGTEPARMIIFDLVERNEHGDAVGHVRADEAVWDKDRQHWVLSSGVRVTGLLPDEKRSPEMPVDFYKSNITPDEVALHRSGQFVNLLSTNRINELLTRQQSFGVADLLRVKHSRIAQWLLNIVLLLLALPCVLSREPTQLKASAMKLLVLTGACLGVTFVCQHLAGQPAPAGGPWVDRWPALMAWTPIILFGPLAVVLLDRVLTKGS